MEYFFDHLPELQPILNGPVIAFFDFDMTLAPVAKSSKDAFMAPSTKEYLTELSSKIPVGIISGRSLDDIFTRVHVNVSSIMYAGNHGAEWLISEKKYAIPFDKESLTEARKRLSELSSQYPQDTFLEDKKYTIAFHYRMAQEKLIPIIEKALADVSFEGVEIRWSKMTFEVRPVSDWNKGSVCLTMIQAIKPSATPLYIGDDLTDEDAFQDLSHGITVRVGQDDKSKAQYYIRNQQEIDIFLEHLCLNIGSQ